MSGPGDVTHAEHAWVVPSSGRTLFYHEWKPPRCEATLIIIHGFGEHAGRYDALARSLAGCGMYVAAPDLWGHGRSSGARGDIHDLSGCVKELRAMVENVLLPGSGSASYAVFGHSFGGLLAIVWALEAPSIIRRLVVQSPFLEVGFRIPIVKKVAANLLALCWPTASLSMNLEISALSRNPQVVQAYRTDPLVHNRMTARTYRAIIRTRDEIMRQAGLLTVPTLLLCGTGDRIISVAVARQWFERLRCRKSVVTFPDSYHELHHEPVREDVIRLTRDWMLNTR